MPNIQVNFEQLYSLVLQLSQQEKINLAQRLRAELSAERMAVLGVDIEVFDFDDIIKEVKITRKELFTNKI
jgi:hypothetical protein